MILAHVSTTASAAPPHGSLTLLAAVLLGCVALVVIAVAVLERLGRFGPGAARLAFRDWSPGILMAASVAAGVIHLAVAADHAREDLVTGVAFVAAGALQIAWGAAFLLRPTRPLALVGLALQGGILAGWAVSRSVGLPFGAHPGVPETIGVGDAAASAFEALVVAGLLLGLVGPAAIRSRLTLATPGAWALSGSSVLVIAVLAIAALTAGAVPAMGSALADGR